MLLQISYFCKNFIFIKKKLISFSSTKIIRYISDVILSNINNVLSIYGILSNAQCTISEEVSVYNVKTYLDHWKKCFWCNHLTKTLRLFITYVCCVYLFSWSIYLTVYVYFTQKLT